MESSKGPWALVQVMDNIKTRMLKDIKLLYSKLLLFSLFRSNPKNINVKSIADINDKKVLGIIMLPENNSKWSNSISETMISEFA